MKIVKPISVNQMGSCTRSTTATYFDNTGTLQTAPANTLRVTYDPTNLTKAPYALVEPAATNLLVGSSDFGQWSQYGTVQLNVAAGPDGTMSADKVTGNGTDGYVSQTYSATAGVIYTASVWLRSDSPVTINLYMYTPDGHSSGASVQLLTAWQRFSLSMQPVVSSGMVVQFGGGGTIANASVYVWGAQLEVGSVATSYIPTTNSPATRAADVLSGSGLMSTTVPENDYPAYSSSTSYTLGQYVIDPNLHHVYQSLRGAVSHVSITYASPTVIGWTAHGLANGTAVTFASTGALPAPLVAGTQYYVVNAAIDWFNVASTLGGSPINTTGSGSGTFTCYDTPNVNNNPSTSPSWWLDCGMTNRWKPFDSLVQSQMTATTTANFVVNTSTTTIDTVALLNANATTASVSAVYTDGTVVYQNTVNLYTDDSPVVDWYTYFFTDFRQQQDIVMTGLPPYLNMNVTLALNGSPGNTVGVGEVVLGKAKDISSAQQGVEQGAKVSITDYSVKTTDDFGNYTITPRAFAKRANWDVWVNNVDMDFVYNLLSSIRTTPILYMGSSQYNSAVIFGYYKSWEVAISYPDISVCTMEIDGLT